MAAFAESDSRFGSQATFTDASRVFLLNVRNREANPATGGQESSVDLALRSSPERPIGSKLNVPRHSGIIQRRPEAVTATFGKTPA
jgi:hypothetical protein